MRTQYHSQAIVRPRVARGAMLFVVILFVIGFTLPLLWVLTSSLRPGNGLFDYLTPLSIRSILPVGGSVQNYAALTNGPFARAILNSVFVSAVTVVVGLAVCTSAAFALSAMRFRGQDMIFSFFVLTFLIPFDAIAVPLAALFQDWHLSNSYIGLILPGIGNGFAIFLLRQFFLGIPRELTEAALVDGLGWLGILVRIFLPLSRPSLIGAGMMLFLSQWQAYVWPLLIGTEPDKQLGPIALANLRGEFTVDYGVLMAGSVVLTAVPLLLMLRFQRHFTQSLASTGLKD